MHEMGIILHMANMLDETAKEQNLTKIGGLLELFQGQTPGPCGVRVETCDNSGSDLLRKLREDLRNCEIWQGMSVLSQRRDMAGGR